MVWKSAFMSRSMSACRPLDHLPECFRTTSAVFPTFRDALRAGAAPRMGAVLGYEPVLNE
jgi:hypothetical protein